MTKAELYQKACMLPLLPGVHRAGAKDDLKLSPRAEHSHHARDAFQPFLIDLVRIYHYQTQPGGAVRGGNQIFPAANAFKNRSGAGGVIQCPHAFLLRYKSKPENTRKRFRLRTEYG